MINTIFYFVNDFDTYQLKVLQHDISAKTIVFVEDQLAIYKDGKRYGNMGYDDIKEKVIEIVTNDEDGKRAAGDAYDDSSLIDALDRIDSITRAEQLRLSDLIQQLDTEIQERVNTMFRDAQWIRENVAQNEYLHQDMTWIGDEINAYLQQVGYWTTDSHGNTITQWSKIQQSVDSISTNVNALSLNVDGRFTAVQSAINQSVDQKIQTAKTELSNMYASGQDVNGIKQVVEWMYSGLKSSAGPDQSVAEIVSAGKNSLVGAISDMRTLVNKLKNGDYVATANLTTQIESYITGQLSTAGLITETTLAQAFSTVFGRLDDPSTGLGAISALDTRVQTLEGGGFLSEATLVAAVQNKATDLSNIAGLQLKSDLDDAVAALVSQTSSTKAAIEVIATGNSSSITVNADDINMTASHKLSLNSDFLNIASNFYSTIANNITLTADKITIDGQHQLDLTSLNLSIAGDQITMSSSHPLALNTTGVTVNGQPFFNAISNELNVDSVVTNKLTSGTGTFKGNVEATSFTAGGQGLTGIVVQSGQFDEQNADTSKVYFAFDNVQNAPTMFIYNPTEQKWGALSFTQACRYDAFTQYVYYMFTNGTTSTPIPANTTSAATANFSSTTLHYTGANDKFYTTNLVDPQYLADGKYLKEDFTTKITNVPNPVQTSNHTDWVTYPNRLLDCGVVLQYLGNGLDGRIVAAEIFVVPIRLDLFSSGTKSGEVIDKAWSPNAVLSYTIDSNGDVSNITRGGAFVQIDPVDHVSNITYTSLAANIPDPTTEKTNHPDYDDAYYWAIVTYNDIYCSVDHTYYTRSGQGSIFGTTFVKNATDYSNASMYSSIVSSPNNLLDSSGGTFFLPNTRYASGIAYTNEHGGGNYSSTAGGWYSYPINCTFSYDLA